jgi:hypothetical protein
MLSKQANTYRELLLRLEKSVQLTQEFNEFWPLIDTVWTNVGRNRVRYKFNTTNVVCGRAKRLVQMLQERKGMSRNPE